MTDELLVYTHICSCGAACGSPRMFSLLAISDGQAPAFLIERDAPRHSASRWGTHRAHPHTA